MNPLRLVLVSTSRADFGAQAAVHRAACADQRFESTLIVCGHHLADGTPRPDELQGIEVVRLPPSADALGNVNQRALLAALEEHRTEVVLINGDRYELLDVAAACCVAGIVLAHAAGGERTLGALDDGVRDALSKLAHLHYPTHEAAATRLRELQEAGDRIYVAGEPALDTLIAEPRPTARELATDLGVEPRRGDLVVALHPATRHAEETPAAIAAIAALASAFPDRRLFLSSVNRDPGAEAISAAWRSLAGDPRVVALPPLGSRRFRGLVETCGVLIGNSSAGLYEAPSLGARSVDLGRRQLGRLAGPSVRRVDPIENEAVIGAVRWALAGDGGPYANPYGDGHAAPRILDNLWAYSRRPGLLVKAASAGEGG